MHRETECEDLIDLGQASVETQGIGVPSFDGLGNADPTGLSDED